MRIKRTEASKPVRVGTKVKPFEGLLTRCNGHKTRLPLQSTAGIVLSSSRGNRSVKGEMVVPSPVKQKPASDRLLGKKRPDKNEGDKRR